MKIQGSVGPQALGLDSIFDRTAVGLGFRRGDGLAGEGGVEGLADVVLGLGDVGGVGGFDAINGTGVDDFSFRIDDEHFGRGFGTVLLADFAGGIEQDGGGGGVLILGVDIGLGAGAVALFAGGRGDDGEPDHPLGGVLLLKPLHAAAGVVLFHKGAFVVEPFEDDKFAAEVGEFVGGAFGVGEGEFWGRLARLDCGGGREDPTDGQDGKEKVFNHPANIPWNVGWSSS